MLYVDLYFKFQNVPNINIVQIALTPGDCH